MNLKINSNEIQERIKNIDLAQKHTSIIRNQLMSDPELLTIKNETLRRNITSSIVYITYYNNNFLPIHTESYILLLIEYFSKIFSYLERKSINSLEGIVFEEIFILEGLCKILKEIKEKRKLRKLNYKKNNHESSKNELIIYKLLKLWIKIPKINFNIKITNKQILDAKFITQVFRNDIRIFYILFFGLIIPITSINEGIIFLEKNGVKKLPPKEKSVFFDAFVILDIMDQIFNEN